MTFDLDPLLKKGFRAPRAEKSIGWRSRSKQMMTGSRTEKFTSR